MANQKEQDSQNSFIIFAITILTLILIPLSYFVLKHPFRTFILKSYKKDKIYTFAPDKPSFKKQIQTHQNEQKYKWLHSYYIFRVILWVVLTLVFINTYQQLPDEDQLRLFNPYEILGLSRSASSLEIRKAYRKLALEYHPDKAIGKEKDFIRITKAYECLEDPKKLQNCERFGNPEGHQGGFSIGIALPSFLIDSQQQGIVLSLIFMSFFTFFAVLVYQVFTSIGKYDKNHVNQM